MHWDEGLPNAPDRRTREGVLIPALRMIRGTPNALLTISQASIDASTDTSRGCPMLRDAEFPFHVF